MSSGFQGWVTHSEVGYAVAEHPSGPFSFRHVVLQGSGSGRWDADVIHNPTMIEYEGRYYLYYMGNKGDGDWWTHRNNQRIGLAVADHPSGPWERYDQPLIDVTPDSWDHLMVSNPTVTRRPDGKMIMVYKGVGEGPLPRGGAVVCGVAVADHPAGPFRKEGKPIMVNPENDWSVEDPYIWSQHGKLYAIVKDFQGFFTKTGDSSVALFESPDGIDWQPSAYPLAFKREIHWADGTVEQVQALERPQLLLDDGELVMLYCAVRIDPAIESYNVAIPLK
jgi:beta-xylosidase